MDVWKASARVIALQCIHSRGRKRNKWFLQLTHTAVNVPLWGKTQWLLGIFWTLVFMRHCRLGLHSTWSSVLGNQA